MPSRHQKQYYPVMARFGHDGCVLDLEQYRRDASCASRRALLRATGDTDVSLSTMSIRPTGRSSASAMRSMVKSMPFRRLVEPIGIEPMTS